jgi:hypothetical protein
MPSKSILKKEFSFYVSSDPDTGAQNVSPDGSTFRVNLNNPIMIPKNALSCEVSTIQSNIWNDSNNISFQFGNNIFNFTTNHSGAPVNYNFVLPDGLYSLSGLNAYLSTQFVNNGLPSNLITLSGDESTQKTILTFLVAGDQVDFTVANSVREVLGFNARLAPLVPQPAGYNEFSDNSAQFNRTNSYLIECDLVQAGIAVNNFNQGIVASVPINVPPGSQITYEPRTPLVIDASDLIGNTRQVLNVRLLNQSLELVTTNEIFSFVLRVVFYIGI